MLMLLILVGGCGTSAPVQMNSIDFAIPDPADAIVNGADQASATTFWASNDGPDLYVLALFADHTGVDHSLCAGAKTPITWQKLSAGAIAVTGSCGVPSLTTITGSVASGRFTANIGGLSSSYTFSISGGSIH
jgi:hypothetical protein